MWLREREREREREHNMAESATLWEKDSISQKSNTKKTLLRDGNTSEIEEKSGTIELVLQT